MSQTLGHYLFNSALPKGHQFNGPINSKELSKTLTAVAKADPVAYVDVVNEVKRLGDEVATVEGISVGLDDIEPHYASRDPLLKDALERVKKTTDATERRKIMLEVQDKVRETAKKQGGDLAMMANSGGRGNFNQFMKTVASPVAVANYTGDIVPWFIKRSYAEGLKPSEYWVAGDEARQNVVSGKIQVTEPGEVGKLLAQTMYDQVVTDPDCGTSNGIPVRADDHGDLVDRYLAQEAGGYPRNTLITSAVARDLGKKLATKPVMVRSPVTCQHRQGGVCAKCFGLSEKGQLHTIGTNVGVRAAQAMSEPLTQMVLSAKHGTKLVKGQAREQQGLDAVKSLVNIPATFMYAATLAKHDGTVSKIVGAPQGGNYVHVSNNAGTTHTMHYVPPDLDVTAHVQQKVEAGDALSTGVPRPDEVVEHKGMGAGRKYLVDRLHKVYADAGMKLDRRHLEMLAKSQLNHVEIEHDPHDEFLRSDVVPFQLVRNRLETSAEEVPVENAEGRVLAQDYTYFSTGTRVTPSVITQLTEHGVHKIKVTTDGLKFKFVMHSLERTPLLNPDWMARMGHRYLKQSIEQGAQFHEESDIHGLHPVPGFVHGVEFGNGHAGHY